MKEQDYIDATNLAKVRMAVTVVRDLLPMKLDEEERQRLILRELLAWQEKLEAKVR